MILFASTGLKIRKGIKTNIQGKRIGGKDGTKN
jgi:hypothetical protein